MNRFQVPTNDHCDQSTLGKPPFKFNIPTAHNFDHYIHLKKKIQDTHSSLDQDDDHSTITINYNHLSLISKVKIMKLLLH